jgi:hypothetical protein
VSLLLQSHLACNNTQTFSIQWCIRVVGTKYIVFSIHSHSFLFTVLAHDWVWLQLFQTWYSTLLPNVMAVLWLTLDIHCTCCWTWLEKSGCTSLWILIDNLSIHRCQIQWQDCNSTYLVRCSWIDCLIVYCCYGDKSFVEYKTQFAVLTGSLLFLIWENGCDVVSWCTHLCHDSLKYMVIILCWALKLGVVGVSIKPMYRLPMSSQCEVKITCF